jgi:flagellar protein FliL
MGLKKKKDGAEGADGEGKEKKGKSNLVPAIVVAIGLIGGGKMMGGGNTAAAVDPASTTTTTLEPGPVVALEPMTMNIEGGSILKVGLALQLHNSGEESGGGGGHGAPAEETDDPHKGYARVLDIAIEVFGKRAYADLVGSEGREAAKHELVEHLHEAYPEEIEDVYLTEFVMSE